MRRTFVFDPEPQTAEEKKEGTTGKPQHPRLYHKPLTLYPDNPKPYMLSLGKRLGERVRRPKDPNNHKPQNRKNTANAQKPTHNTMMRTYSKHWQAWYF